MSEPRRLRESGDTVEKSLLDAMVDGRPSSEARARMAATLGIGSAVAATVVGTSTAAGATAAASKGGGALVFLKWGAALVIVGGAGTAGVVHVQRAQRVHSTEVASPSAVASVAARTPAPMPAPQEAAEDVGPAAPAPSSLHPARIGTNPPPGGSNVQAPSISRELASLERIRRAIDAGDGRKALEALAVHQREFSSGALTIEADYLRIEALILSGDTQAARARARRFLAAHPSAPQARRVESMLRDLRDPEKK